MQFHVEYQHIVSLQDGRITADVGAIPNSE